MSKQNADDVSVVEYTVRAPCRNCGHLYVWPKGSKAPSGIGPCCQAPLDGVLSEPPPLSEPAVYDESPAPTFPCQDCGEPTTTLYCLVCVPGGLPGLCVHCRTTEAEAWLDGVPCCTKCADVVIERQTAQDEFPQLHFPELDATAFLEQR